MSEHAKLSPSGAGIWGFCSGTRAASSRFSDQETEANRIGTAAHEVGALCLEHGLEPELFIGQAMSNGIVVDREMVDCVQIYVDNVRSASMDKRDVLIERRTYMPQIHQSVWGTLDAAYLDYDANRIYLWDYKHGHRHVKAEANLQMICYALGLINHYNITHDIEFVFRIVQPRSYSGNGPVESWVVRSSDLVPYIEQLRVKAHEALEGTPTLTTGSHCRYCPAIGVCSAARQASYNIMDFVNEAYALDEMDDADVGLEYELMERAIKVMQARRDALSDELTFRVENGSNSTGYSLVSKAGKWEWLDDDDALWVASEFGVDAKVESVRTVAQVRSELSAAKRKEFDELRSFYAQQKTGKAKLTPTSETVAAKVFGGNKHVV